MSKRKKIAAIVTAYFPESHGSHADLLVSKFATGFPCDDGISEPKVDLVSMYIDQPHWTTMGKELANQWGVQIYPSIRGALTLKSQERPGHWTPEKDTIPGELAVDGVIIVAEHGDYAANEQQRQLYPRKQFFEQVCGVIAYSKRPVPIFNDKHLSYNWSDSLWMYNRSRELNIPFMAGSALPLCSRGPELEHPIGTKITEALCIGYIHPFLFGLDSYGFHALEGLQCMVERRDGGETGIVSVQCLEGQDVWKAARKGLWSRELAEAAELAVAQQPPLKLFGKTSEVGRIPVNLKTPGLMEKNCNNPVVFLIEYADGMRGSTLLLPGHLYGFGYAATVNHNIQSTGFIRTGDQQEPFAYQGLNIQKMFLTGKPQYPVERTLLVSGVLEALMESRYQGHINIRTPHLNIGYKPYNESPIRIT
ncbi:MAG: hypothetical protein VX701_00780 [Chloroflexota bacterium]|nr:hypothetical protein [Chloroflexota bacterium]